MIVPRFSATEASPSQTKLADFTRLSCGTPFRLRQHKQLPWHGIQRPAAHSRRSTDSYSYLLGRLIPLAAVSVSARRRSSRWYARGTSLLPCYSYAAVGEDTEDFSDEDFELGMDSLWEILLDRFEELPDAGIERRASSIVGAGDGLWSTRSFAAGDVVAIYGGTVIDAEEVGTAQHEGKVLQTEAGTYLDGRCDADWTRVNALALGQYCNHAGGRQANTMVTAIPASRSSGQELMESARELLHSYVPKEVAAGDAPLVFFLALDDIPPGEELLLDYQLNPDAAPAWYIPALRD